ncbi:MAG TPA: hypothetical protein VML92_03310, partial [Steroidobacteraceae bacterium]|nr:hypothetical protein [Steroidobacteraceae bacterium]
TACPVQWRSALNEVLAGPLERAIPGHGEPMTPKQIGIYRDAFSAFIGCVNTDAVANACATAWADGIASFTVGDGRKRDSVLRNAEYYVGMLRENGGKTRLPGALSGAGRPGQSVTRSHQLRRRSARDSK